RIAIGLMSLGHRVTGVDVSAAMLKQAQENARSFGFELSLYQQDLRQLRLSDRFDGAVCLCDSLNYLTEHSDFTQALQKVADALKPGGIFLFDVNTEWKLEHVYGD